eukprot:PhM_4_TR6885/c0_g1_i1/m.27943
MFHENTSRDKRKAELLQNMRVELRNHRETEGGRARIQALMSEKESNHVSQPNIVPDVPHRHTRAVLKPHDGAAAGIPTAKQRHAVAIGRKDIVLGDVASVRQSAQHNRHTPGLISVALEGGVPTYRRSPTTRNQSHIFSDKVSPMRVSRKGFGSQRRDTTSEVLPMSPTSNVIYSSTGRPLPSTRSPRASSPSTPIGTSTPRRVASSGALPVEPSGASTPRRGGGLRCYNSPSRVVAPYGSPGGGSPLDAPSTPRNLITSSPSRVHSLRVIPSPSRDPINHTVRESPRAVSRPEPATMANGGPLQVGRRYLASAPKFEAQTFEQAHRAPSTGRRVSYSPSPSDRQRQHGRAHSPAPQSGNLTTFERVFARNMPE